jgi:hypothetical protein
MPPEDGMSEIPIPTGETQMAKQAGEVDATIDKVLDQAYSRAHEDWLGTRVTAEQGHQFINEVNRWSMQAAATDQLFLASGILAQRSAQAQPQSPGGAGQAGVPGQKPGT